MILLALRMMFLTLNLPRRSLGVPCSSLESAEERERLSQSLDVEEEVPLRPSLTCGRYEHLPDNCAPRCQSYPFNR
ncbi:hypothetical protein E2C01_003961 [Portunus trituberculatus]|uniref:Secreted protein n=1 Tax=Portunus trituberculatus TaxID=210409 RepID=A0A5B7CPC7_PORTR|nr:hypothetical protein [Portunus trituberculatus]